MSLECYFHISNCTLYNCLDFNFSFTKQTPSFPLPTPLKCPVFLSKQTVPASSSNQKLVILNYCLTSSNSLLNLINATGTIYPKSFNLISIILESSLNQNSVTAYSKSLLSFLPFAYNPYWLRNWNNLLNT